MRGSRAHERRGAAGAAVALGLALVVGAVVLAGCSSSSTGSSDALTVYSGQHVQTTQALIAAFEKADGHPGQPAE